MMPSVRTIIDIPKDMLDELDSIRTRQKCSRASLIRKAIQSFLKKQPNKSNFDEAFGAWKEREADGVDYQNELPGEWKSS